MQKNVSKISSRRIEVLNLVREGKANPEIQKQLQCSLNTITSVRRMVRREAAGSSWVPKEMTAKQKRIADAISQGKSINWITENLRCSGGNIVDVRARMTEKTKTPAKTTAKTATKTTTKATAKAATKTTAKTTTKAAKGEGRSKAGDTVVVSRSYLEALEIVTSSFVEALKNKSVIDVFLATFKDRNKTTRQPA